jgi:antitoxin component of MazEF toxin-antitoxin module
MKSQIVAKVLRKVSRTGGSLTVRLPKDWARAQDIEVGDALLIEIKAEGTLEIKKREGE